MTYSIVCRDPVRGYLCVGTASGSIAVGSRVPWARSGVGAVATQAYTNPSLGPLILGFIEEGMSARDALAKALSTDQDPSMRQVAVIDHEGFRSVYSGENIPREHGEAIVEDAACIGNLLADPIIPEAMCRAFAMEESSPPYWRVLNGLMAAEKLGGDARGDRSAAILVVGPTQYGRLYDRILDVRVDYDPNRRPVERLGKILDMMKDRI